MFVSSLFNRSYSIIINKDDLTNENATIMQVLKENVYEEGIISKILRKLKLSQPQHQTQVRDIQEGEIKMSIKLL